MQSTPYTGKTTAGTVQYDPSIIPSVSTFFEEISPHFDIIAMVHKQ